MHCGSLRTGAMAIVVEKDKMSQSYDEQGEDKKRRNSLEQSASRILTRNGLAPRGSIGSGDSNLTLLGSTASSVSAPSSPCSTVSCSRESVAAALDSYIAASTEGREAFTMGDVGTAVKHFDRALDIELQTELECLYDTSIGFMSGLVRSEVDAVAQRQNEYSDKCERILRHLSSQYSRAVQGLSKKRSDPKWFLQMGAALVVVNEWDKAKTVYTEGVNTCKDRKALKYALKNLTKLEQMTSYGDIPAEDQPKNTTPTASPRVSPAPSPQHSPRRDRSKSLASRERHLRRDRVLSLSLENDQEVRQRKVSEAISPSTSTANLKLTNYHNKRASFSFFGSKKISLLTPDTAASWGTCFDPEACLVLGQPEFQPSAITHMRNLSALNYDDMYDGSLEDTISRQPAATSGKFNSVKLTSLKIEDDDSELDDSD